MRAGPTKPWLGSMDHGAIMSDSDTSKVDAEEEGNKPFRIRLPGFVSEKDVGLGDVIKRATSAFGIRTCGQCSKRAALLNRRFVFTGKRQG